MKNYQIIATVLFLALVSITVLSYELDRQDKVIYVQILPNRPVVVPIVTNEMPIFMEALGFRESSDNYQAVNRFGYIGRYQFGEAALEDLGIVNRKRFLTTPSRQDKAFVALCKINKYRLRHFISEYEGLVINGIVVTESGLLAAAHLVGATAVKRYLKSDGVDIKKDGNHISLEHYLELFQGYNLEIEANRIANL